MSKIQRPGHNILDAALFAAIRTIADLDESMPSGNAAVVPDVIRWMMEKTNPELMSEIQGVGLTSQALALIDDYTRLRRIALSSISNGPLPSDRYPCIGFDDLKAVLDQRAEELSTEFLTAFDSIAPAVQERLNRAGAAPSSEVRLSFPTKVRGDENIGCDHRGQWEYAAHLADFPYFAEAPFDDEDDVKVALHHVELDFERMDDGEDTSFWEHLSISEIEAWLARYLPSTLRDIERQNRMCELHEAATQYVACMRATEHQWKRLGAPLRGLLEVYAGGVSAIDIIQLMLDAAADESARQVSSLGVYWMFCRRLRTTAPQPTIRNCNVSSCSR